MTNHMTADIIVLGCSLPGMVTAHKLKKTFGDTIEIVILDLVNKPKSNDQPDADDDHDGDYVYRGISGDIVDNLTKYYLTIFAEMFKIRIPKSITAPETVNSNLRKVFENDNGDIETYDSNLHEYNYLNVFGKFELNQYHMALDESMKDLFKGKKMCNAAENKNILYLDRTNMDQDICSSLLFPSSRNIMRNMVNLVCGVPPDKVSVLFFLYQCYRSGSIKNNLDGQNTKLREKLLGYFKKYISIKLYKIISNIVISTKPIVEISLYLEEKVMIKTQGDANYVCNILAMALKPDRLDDIEFESALLNDSEKNLLTSMSKGKLKKFWIQYQEKFWRRDGYSGDIFSLRGPILWAMEQKNLPHTIKKDIYPVLIGYLKCNGDDKGNSEEAVKQQLAGLFGDVASRPVRYMESEIDDIYVPICGNFIALRRLLDDSRGNILEWGALDVYAEGDVAAALEAGHNAYLHLLAFLRPQAQSYEDLALSSWPTFFNSHPIRRWFSRINFTSSTRLVLYATAVYMGYRVMRHLNS